MRERPTGTLWVLMRKLEVSGVRLSDMQTGSDIMLAYEEPLPTLNASPQRQSWYAQSWG